MRTTVVIPSYWGRSWKEPINCNDDLYDHPTPIDEEGTLRRALQSFMHLEEQDFAIVVIGVAACKELQNQCQEKLGTIIESSGLSVPVHLFSYSQADMLKEKLRLQGYEELTPLVSLQGYSNARNACLISAILMNSEIAIFFDDDEIISDPMYIARARDLMGMKFENNTLIAKAGYYIRPEGNTYKIPPQEDWVWAEWGGAQAMNKAFEIIEKPPRFKLTPFAFGGNMVVHQSLFSKVSFDPNVRRGEDIDYLTNAKMFGHNFFLDNELHIKHMPPKSRTPAWQGFRENIYRFVYSRAKLKAQRPAEGMYKVTAEDLDPYPGIFLKDDLLDKIYKTSVLLALDYLSKNDQEGFREALDNIAIAKYRAVPEFDPFELYLSFNQKWQRLVSLLSGDSQFRVLEELGTGA